MSDRMLDLIMKAAIKEAESTSINADDDLWQYNAGRENGLKEVAYMIEKSKNIIGDMTDDQILEYLRR